MEMMVPDRFWMISGKLTTGFGRYVQADRIIDRKREKDKLSEKNKRTDLHTPYNRVTSRYIYNTK